MSSFPRSTLSRHAEARVIERFAIDPSELLGLLNQGLGKKIGRSRETHLAHRLIWSCPDSCLLVAIQDVVDGIVLTVLTEEMYSNTYQLNITDRRAKIVINQMVHCGLAPPHLWSPDKKADDIMVYAAFGTSIKQHRLGHWKGDVPSPNVEDIGSLSDFWEWVTETLSLEGHSLEELHSVHAGFRGGSVKQVPYAC